jgi:hypothetical protein
VPTRLLASPLGLGCAVAGLTGAALAVRSDGPRHPQPTTSLDLQWYFFGVYEAFFGTLRAGQPMLWNPYQLCGIPWLGTLQGGFFYPPHLLYLFLPTPWALALCTSLHLALAAGATAVFARRAGLSAAASMLAAALFGLAGPIPKPAALAVPARGLRVAPGRRNRDSEPDRRRSAAWSDRARARVGDELARGQPAGDGPGVLRVGRAAGGAPARGASRRSPASGGP